MPERVAYQMNALIGGLKYDPQLVPAGAHSTTATALPVTAILASARAEPCPA
jgi:hypothetical protein